MVMPDPIKRNGKLTPECWRRFNIEATCHFGAVTFVRADVVRSFADENNMSVDYINTLLRTYRHDGNFLNN